MILELFCYKNYQPLPDYRKDLSSDLEVVGTKHFGLFVKDLKEALNYCLSNGICKNADIKHGRLGRYYFL